MSATVSSATHVAASAHPGGAASPNTAPMPDHAPKIFLLQVGVTLQTKQLKNSYIKKQQHAPMAGKQGRGGGGGAGVHRQTDSQIVQQTNTLRTWEPSHTSLFWKRCLRGMTTAYIDNRCGACGFAG